MTKAILFDLDNTLIDFMKMKTMATESAISAMIDAGLEVDKKKAKKILWEEYLKLGLEHQEIFQNFLQKIVGKVDTNILAAGVVGYRKVKEAFLEPYPNVISTLVQLIKEGYKLGIVTNAPPFQAWSRLHGMKLQHFFDVVTTSEDTGQEKPSQLPFKAALEKLGLEASEVMMVGDDVEKDIIPAKNLGMTTVLAKYGELGQSGKADHEINDISELLDIV